MNIVLEFRFLGQELTHHQDLRSEVSHSVNSDIQNDRLSAVRSTSMESRNWISIPDSDPASTLIDVPSSRDGIDIEVPSSRGDVISVPSSGPQLAMPVFSMAVGDSVQGSSPPAGSAGSSSHLELLQARVAAARAAREAAEERAAEAAAQAELLEASALSTRSQAPSVPTSSTHEQEMQRLLETHGVPLHRPVLPTTEGDAVPHPRAPHGPVLDPRIAQVLEANQRLAEHLQADENRGGHDLGFATRNSYEDPRDVRIDQLRAQVRNLQAQQKKVPEVPPEVNDRVTIPPSMAASTAMEDLRDVFAAPAAAFGTALTRIPSEVFATPRITEDLIDLSSPDRGPDHQHQDVVAGNTTSPGYRAQIDELRGEISNLRAQIPALPSWSTVDLPPGLTGEHVPVQLDDGRAESDQGDFHAVDVREGYAGPDIPPGHRDDPPDVNDLLGPLGVVSSRSKEPDTIRLNSLPDMAKFEEWKCNVRDEVTAAAGGSTHAYLWILQVEDSRITYEQLEDAQQFKSIDAKIAAAVSRIQKGELAKVITSKKKEAARLLRRISGRQQLRIVYDQYKLDAEDGQLFDIEDLMAIKFPGDDHLESFIVNWDTGLLALVDDPGEELKRSLFHRLIKHSTKMRDVLTRYTLAARGSHERSYRFLHSGVHQIVDMERNLRNRRDLIQSRNMIGGKGKPTMAAHEQSDIPPPPQAPQSQPDATKVAMAAKGAGKTKSSRPCYDWLLGTCKKGTGCPFSHAGQKGAGQEAVDKEKKALAEKRSSIPCEMHRKGRCRFGDKCQFLHSDEGSPSPAGVCQSPEEQISTSLAMITLCSDRPEWCLDTGSENHLVDQASIDPQDLADRAYETQRPLRLATANGEIVAKTRIDHHLDKVNLTINPLVLQSTVNAISVGRLVIDNGMTFHWDTHGAHLMDNQGHRIECVIRGYVPMLRDEGSSDCNEHSAMRTSAMPGVDASGQEGDLPSEHAPGVADPEIMDEASGQASGEPAEVPNHQEAEPGGESLELRLREEAASQEHSLTHRPKNPYCPWCMRAKVHKRQARRRDPDTNHMEVKGFGELVQCDHVILHRAEHAGLDGERAGLFIMDTFTDLCDLVPSKGKTAEEAAVALRYFVGERDMKFLYSDNSLELKRAAEILRVPHPTSTPYRPENNGKVERRIGVMAEGVRAALLQSGLPHRFWTLASRHHLFATAISVNPRAADGLSAWERHHGVAFDGLRIPFGSLIFYRPKKSELDSMAKFAPRTVPGLFVGWHTKPGYQFQGDYLVIALAAFKPTEADRARKFNVFRVKEVMNIGPLNFPLQGSSDGSEALGIVDFDWDSRDLEIEEQENSDNEALGHPNRPFDDLFGEETSFDRSYEELFGEEPPVDMTAAEKYEAIAERLFGPDPPAPGEISEMHEKEPVIHEDSLREVQEISERDLFGDLEEQNMWEKSQATRNAKMPIPREKKLPGPGGKKVSASGKSSSCTEKAAISWTTDPGAMLDRGYLTMVASNREHDRLLLEYCCSPDSKIGQQAENFPGCEVIRLTEEINMTSEGEYLWAESKILKAPKSTYIFMWSAIPCTPGSPWQRINRLKPGVSANIEAQIVVTKKLVSNFTRLARLVLQRGGDVAFEWPAQCSMWALPEVAAMISELSQQGEARWMCSRTSLVEGGTD